MLRSANVLHVYKIAMLCIQQKRIQEAEQSAFAAHVAYFSDKLHEP